MDLKRTIDELHALYGLEPEIKDVFVEGPVDKSFLDWYLRQHKWMDISVYSVDIVEVPDALLTSYSLPLRSKRSRVIALSLELSRRLVEQRRVMCIVDRDSDDQISDEVTNPYLFYTDGNSLELYALTPAIVEKFLLVCLGGFPLSADNLISQMLEILQRIFAIRQANLRLGWAMKWIPFCNFVTVEVSSLTFRESDFIRAYLQKNNRSSSREQFQRTIDEAFGDIDTDIRRTIRGHDLSKLLRLVIMKIRKTRVFGNAETVEGCLMTAIETNDLNEQALFVTLKNKMTTPM